MSLQHFLEERNIQLLWEVLINEPIIKRMCDSEVKVTNIMRIFQTNVKEFYEVEKNNCNNLIELNKKFILLLINYLFAQQTQDPPQNLQQKQYLVSNRNKITIHDDMILSDSTSKELITYEDIQNERVNQFEKKLSLKQQEFANSVTTSKPPVPDFSDKLDEPISEMDLEVKKIQEQRNYDIEIINKTFQDANRANNANNTNNATKNTSNERHISWDLSNEIELQNELQNEIQNETQYESNNNILDKLKRTTSSHDIYELKNEVSKLNDKLNLLIERFDIFINKNDLD